MTGPALVAAGLTLLVNAVLIAVAWGALRATVQALKKDVEDLQKDMQGLNDLKIQVARLSERQDMILEQLRDLNASVRWLRDPAPPYRPGGLPKGTTDK